MTTRTNTAPRRILSGLVIGLICAAGIVGGTAGVPHAQRSATAATLVHGLNPQPLPPR